MYFKYEFVFCILNVCYFTFKIKLNKIVCAYVLMRGVHLFVLMWVRVFNVEEYYTQRKRCQLTRCRVDQHSSKVRSLMAAALFERDNCSFFCCTQIIFDRYCCDIVDWRWWICELCCTYVRQFSVGRYEKQKESY